MPELSVISKHKNEGAKEEEKTAREEIIINVMILIQRATRSRIRKDVGGRERRRSLFWQCHR